MVEMKYAIVNGELQEAQPGLSGTCKSCGHPTIARCGKVKIRHWAHIGKLMCDPWWEKENEGITARDIHEQNDPIFKFKYAIGL